MKVCGIPAKHLLMIISIVSSNGMLVKRDLTSKLAITTSLVLTFNSRN
jgi:hypothetical protein